MGGWWVVVVVGAVMIAETDWLRRPCQYVQCRVDDIGWCTPKTFISIKIYWIGFRKYFFVLILNLVENGKQLQIIQCVLCVMTITVEDDKAETSISFAFRRRFRPPWSIWHKTVPYFLSIPIPATRRVVSTISMMNHQIL